MILAFATTLLADLARRLAVARDYIRGVARQYATGLYLFGRPGAGKTRTVQDVLEREIGELYCYQRGHLTPVGLFELLADHPDEVIVLDDLVTIFKSDMALQILLSALEHPAPGNRTRTRVLTYRRMGEEVRVPFRGGVICIANRELHDDDMLGAFKSRVHALYYDPSDGQLSAALMLYIADKGWPAGRPSIPPAKCVEVARFVIGEMLRLGCRFDLRFVRQTRLPDYWKWKDGATESGSARPGDGRHRAAPDRGAAFDGQLTREERKQEEYAVLREILRAHPSREERVRAWTSRTGKSERAYYRRLGEMG